MQLNGRLRLLMHAIKVYFDLLYNIKPGKVRRNYSRVIMLDNYLGGLINKALIYAIIFIARNHCGFPASTVRGNDLCVSRWSRLFHVILK